ncbi:MAG: class I SAM-dependent methyltransferase [Nocardioidaceae bacterium]|nr:MAG: class I SAM-dependent methyltransferase [Nocardioidaceae bacterium]
MEDTTSPSPRALSFATVADEYDRSRPGYPLEAAEYLVGVERATVLEVGAGTGKFTDQLISLDHDVLATDPLLPMLQHLIARHPSCRTLVASAEDLPIPSRSVDTVVAAQAFHWFDIADALAEIARVLRPEGTLGLVWNERDSRIPWVRRLNNLLDEADDIQTTPDPTEILLDSGLFGFVESETFRFWQPLGRQQLRELVMSRSGLAMLDPVDRDQLLDRVDALFDKYAQGREGMRMPYLTHCFRAVVRPVVLEDSGPIQLSGAGTMPSAPTPDDATHLFSLS